MRIWEEAGKRMQAQAEGKGGEVSKVPCGIDLTYNPPADLVERAIPVC